MTRILSQHHVLAVNDIARSAEYYIQALGFTRDFSVEGWEFLSLGEFRVMLGECPDEISAGETNNHSYFAHVLVDDVDTLFKDVQTRGATIISEVEDKPWGHRQFAVATPDGHRILFAQEIDR